MNTLKKTPIYQNPPKDLESDAGTSSRQELHKMAASVGLRIEWHTGDIFLAIYTTEESTPEAWSLLASPLSPNEAWHWLNGYAAGRSSK